MGTRIDEHSTWTGSISENLIRADTAIYTTEEILIMEFIIDDNVSSRGHRENIFNASHTKVGLGIAEDSQGRDMVTQVFADAVTCNDCGTYTDT